MHFSFIGNALLSSALPSPFFLAPLAAVMGFTDGEDGKGCDAME